MSGVPTSLVLVACGSSDDGDSSAIEYTTTTDGSVAADPATTSDDVTGATPVEGIDVGLFFDGALVGEPAIEDWPDVDPSLQNHGVESRLEWLENGEPITTTVQIPTEPVAADAAASPQGNQGVTFDGVVIVTSAPVELFLGAYTIAAFDNCGAHFNPFDGYHYHANSAEKNQVVECLIGQTAARRLSSAPLSTIDPSPRSSR